MNSLLVALEHAQEQLDKGKVKQAVNAMRAFRNQVVDLIATGELPASEGQFLLDDIDVLIAFYS